MPGPLTAPPLTIVCRYSCPTCGILDRPIQVRAREPAEDILAFVRRLGDAIGVDHRQIAPGCRGPTCNIKIPWPVHDGQQIGEVPLS